MKNLELFFDVTLVVIVPLLAISIVSRIVKICKNGPREVKMMDFINVLNCIIMPCSLQIFYERQEEMFMSALWPSGLCLASIMAVILLIALISRFYTDIEATTSKATFVCLFPFTAMVFIGYGYVSETLNFWQMIALTLLQILVAVSVCCFGPVRKEFKLRQLRERLEGERKNILKQNERKYRRLKTKELENLLDEYLKLHPDDYAKYDRYSKDKRYPRPLVSGSEIIDLRINVISGELRSRAWNNF